MTFESIAHEAEGRMGYWLRAYSGLSALLQYKCVLYVLISRVTSLKAIILPERVALLRRWLSTRFTEIFELWGTVPFTKRDFLGYEDLWWLLNYALWLLLFHFLKRLLFCSSPILALLKERPSFSWGL